MEKTLQIAQEKIKQLEKANSNLETLVDQLQHNLTSIEKTIRRQKRKINFENENIESLDCPSPVKLSPSRIETLSLETSDSNNASNNSEKTWAIIIPRLTFADQLQLLKTSKQLEKLCLDDAVHKLRVHVQRLNDDKTLYVQ